MLNKEYETRMKIMLLTAAVVFLVLLSRLAYLQLYKGAYYGKQADGNRLRSTRILAPRGLILDKTNKPLVNNFAGYTVCLQPHLEYKDETLALLGRILGLNPQEIRRRLKAAQNSYEPVRVKNNLSANEITTVEEYRQEIPGVMLELQPERKYLYNELAVHALGYTGEVSEYELEHGLFKGVQIGSIVGKGGLEQQYDSILRGTDGQRNEEVDVRGKVVRQMESIEPKTGRSLVLTLDLRLQKALEKAVDAQLKELRGSGLAPNAYGASVVAMDPRSGAIRALVSRPAFNPNLFIHGISSKDWQTINEDLFHPMTDKAISGEYPAGSTFKVVTGTAALDLHKVDPEELILDPGYHWAVPSMGNAGGEVLGWLNFQSGFAASDNVYFYELGRRTGVKSLVEYAHKYGFGRPTGLGLSGEASGLVPSPELKKKLYPGSEGEWTLGDTFNMSIGQGMVLVTPIQLAQMLSIVVENGVKHQPYLVEQILNYDGSLSEVPERKPPEKVAISEETLKLVRQGLEAVTQAGGTASYFSSLPVPVGGKTGTAENPHGKDHGLFIAYAPADQPELVIVCVVEQGSFGSSSAGPIVYKGLEEYLKERAGLPEAAGAEETAAGAKAAPAKTGEEADN